MAMTRRPSALASACVPAGRWPAMVAPARVQVPGLSAVEVRPRTAPVFGFRAGTGMSSKINYMGYANAKGDGLATSALLVSILGQHQVQADKATGGDARGLLPRGRPV